MVTRILAVTTVLLAALVVYQYGVIDDLRSKVAAAHAMEGQRAEVQRAIEWLNDFYKSPDGLQRPQGLWIDGHPDFVGIGAWVFDYYLPERRRGKTEEDARQAVETAIKRSDEWRSLHKG
jgi:hypothetical protein